MSDFFMPNQNNQEIKDQEAENYRNAANNIQNQQIEEYKQKRQQHLENWDRYGVNVPDEYYDAFNKIIAQAPTPEAAQEEAYKIGSAVKYSEAMGIPLLEAYQNVDAFNEAQFTDLQGQKGRFEALSDMLNLGRNNVKLGRLGQELMQAHINNDTELANSLMAEIDAINQQNQLMQDNAPRSWVMQALEAGAQSLPFTGVVAGAGIVGNFIAPAAGTAASFAASSYLSAGTEYIDMIANGASPDTARLVATVSGGIQGLIEADLGISKSIVKSTARVIGKEAAENAAKKSVEEIGRKVFKRFHFGAGKKVLLNYLENRGKDILGEGTEEFLQEITSIVGQEVAASLDGYDIPDDDMKHIVKQTTEAFKGGVLGALSMGFIPAGINAAADVREYKLIKDTAELFESEEMFKEVAKDSPVFEGMSDAAKTETIHEVWQRAQNRKEVEAQQIAEGRDAAEGAEEAPAENEDGTTEANPVARNEAGRLYTSDDVSTDDAGNVTGGTFVIGDKTKSENNRYGYIKYSQDAEGNITIDTFKMTEGRDKLRAEAFDEFAREHPDVNIEWNATAPDLQDFKNELIDANPSGKKNGLNYYSTTDLDNVAARKRVAEELRKNIHNVKRNADGSYTQTELNNKQIAAGVTLIESAARRMNMGLNEYINKTFGNQIFGSREEFAAASLAQGEDVNKKAGGMIQGVAQANWREVGQQIKAVIYAGEHADFSTWAHEMAHVFQNQLDGQLKTDAEAAFNVQNGDWVNSTYTFKDGRTMSSAEAFAYGFQDWLETGKAENEQMRNIFQKFAEFIADCYNRLKKHLDFTPEIESVFNQLLDGDDTIMSKALKAAQEQDNEYRASLKRQAEEKQAAKETEKEEAKKQAEAAREEASEGTEFTEAEPTAEELLNGIEEAENETKKTTEETNAIDNALENTNLTDEQKGQIAETLKDEGSTVVEKAEATTEAAESVYEPYDLFQNEGALLSQLIGEPAIQKMAKSALQKQILDKLKLAVMFDENGVDALQIRYATGWEKDGAGEWKYETDDSINKIKDFEAIYRAAKTGESLKVKDVLDADKLYEILPFIKDLNVRFTTAPSNQSVDIDQDGIIIFTKTLEGLEGENGLKGALAEAIQYYIQVYEYANNNEEFKNKVLDIHNKRTELVTNMQKAQAAKELNVKYDAISLRNQINNILQDRGIIEARNVARRVMYDALKRKDKRIAETEEKQQLLSQEENPDFLEAVNKAQDLLFQDKLTMYGIHNLSEDALRHAVKMGGLANPSMAVVDTEKNSFTNFGEVSLIPYNYMLEKGEGSKGTFGADIYSPRYPSIDKRVTETGQKKIHSIFHAIEDESYKNQLEEKLVQKIENSSKQFDYAYSPLVMAYLAEKGNKDFYKYEKSEYSDEVKDLIKSLGASPNAMAEADNKVILEAYSKHLKKDYEEQLKKLREDFEELKANPKTPEWIKNSRSRAIEKLQEDLDIANETIKELVDEKTGLFNGNVADDFLYRVRHEIESAGKIDYSASEYAARELIENDPKFLPWAKEAYDRIEKEERIFNGFTPSGNRRYLAHTLENVSKYMRQQELQGGESFYYGLGSTRAKFTPNFKTLNQIKKARDRLVTSEEFEKIKEEYNERFDKITEALGDKYDPDVGAARFEEAFEYGKSDPIGYIEKEYGISVDDDMAQEILDFATALRVMPTEYFETKYTRPVTLNEFAGAIIPSNLSQDLKDTLAEKGLMIEEYDREAGNREEVTKAALQKFNETRRVLFQNIGEYGAENLDEAEGGTTRLDNLRTAKKMEEAGKDAKTIRLATAWEKGDDGKWRYELDDSKIKVESDFMPDKYFLNKYPRFAELQHRLEKDLSAYDTFTDAEKNDYDFYSEQLSKFLRNHIDFTGGKKTWKEPVELNDVMDAPELFKAYPQLEKIKFIVKNLESGTMGQYDGNTDTITLSPSAGKSTLLHEVQHAIQEIEGFAKGGSERQFDEISAEPLREKVSDLNKKMSEVLTEYVPLEDWLAIDQKLLEQNLSPEEYVQARIDAISKYDNGEYRKLAEEQQEIISRIEEIEENALEGQVEINGRTYADAFEAYRSLAGEVEARNVQTRMSFTPEQRLKTLLRETEDVAPEDKIILFQEVYHGSGADFDKFDTENYGLSGEGSMSFGYGTYLTDNEDIARDYANRQGLNFDKVKITDDNRLYYDIAFNISRGFTFEDAKEKLLESTKKSIEQRKNYIERVKASKLSEEDKKFKLDYSEKRLQEDIADLEKIEKLLPSLTVEDVYNKLGIEKRRYLYTVEIPDDGYLNWEERVSLDTTQQIVEELKKQHDELVSYSGKLRNEDLLTFEGITGSGVYSGVKLILGGSDKAASQFLHSIGYAGIKYPAGTIHGNGNGAYNYVIFNDDDAKIVDKLLFQTNAELMDEARGFDSWQEFMEYCEVMHADDEISPIPGDADAQWYQTFYETANGVQTEQEKNEEAVQAKNKKEGALPGAVDALFTTMIASDPEMVDSFLQAVADIDAIDLDSEEWQQAENVEDAAQRDKIAELKDFINITLSDYNWQTALRRIQGGHEISEGLRKRLIGEMTDSFKARDFRALYAEVMNDEQYAVAPEDSITAVLNKKLKKYHDIVKPTDDVARWSPERRKQLAEQLQNRELADKIRRGDLKLDDELDAYIKSLNKQIKEKQKQFDELEAETKADYQRIADKERRDLLKLHEQLLLASGKLKTRNQEIERKIKKGLKITEKYRYITQNLNANYDELFRKYNDLRNSITINAEIQAALDRQEQVAGLRDDLNAKQKEKNLTAEVKKMRIQLVKRTMRRVPFNRIDYNNARTVIAIQRMLEPNLLGGVNRFIGIDSPYLRGVISQIVTDSDYKEKIMNYLSKNAKASQAFADFKKKLTELKSIKDFDSWTAKERKAAIRYLPKENWVRDLNLKELAKEREESIDLDIGMEEVKRTVYDEKTGEPKTYKDAEGTTHNVTETAFRLKYDEELGRLVQDAVGADMFDKIVNMPFSEWTTEDLEGLAQRIDEIYTEGRDLKAAKDEARKNEAAAIRKRIEDAIKETGITINDDDTPEEKERKQKQIDKILGMTSDLKGTEAGKSKGFMAKITRLLHSYSDMNVLRFARMLDGQSEGENVRMLYRKEDDCYNAKQRSMNSRAEKINKVMKDNNITEGDLAEVVKVPSLGTEFTVDELLYFLAADKDYAEDEKKLQRGLFGIDANDDYAATSRNAVMFGNMMSDMMSQEEKESWLQLDKEMEEALQNDTLTQEQKEQLATGQLDKKPGTTRYIMACHAKWEAVLGAANNYLSTHPEYKALMEAIEADYAEQYGRMNEVSINEFNMPVHRVKAYVPLVRRESNGDTNENQVKEDLLGAAGVGKQWADRGMTQRRVQISPLNQKPVQTGLFRTWGDSIERTEHFIAYAPYVRQLNAIYKSRDASYTRRYIESRYGNGAIKYLDEYINEVANPNAGRIRERGAEWLHVLRGKTAPAYLGWKASAIIKQGLTSPWPYMQFVNPAEYVSAAMKFTFNPEMREAIKEKSVFMKMRRMDPVNDLIDEMADNAKTKLDRGWSNFSKLGMQGLELIDWACVAPGWLACYEKKYNQLQNASNARYEAKMAELKERNMYAEVGTSEYLTPQQMEAEAKKEMLEDIEAEAVRYADDCTRACQPSNRVTDLAPLFKNSSEAMKAFLQFQTSLNVIWQNLRYDMPYAVKNKEFTRIAGTVIGYVCAGIFMNSVMEGIGGDDDDDETQALRNLIYYSTTQFTDAIPIMGSEITNTMDQLITGKRGFYGSGTDMTPSATKLLSVLTTAKKGNWEKAAELTAEGIGLYLGAPVSGTKEINKLLGKPLKEGDVNLKRGISDVYGIAGDILEE